MSGSGCDTPAVVVAGVGNALRGDDAAGSLLVRGLQGGRSARVLDCEELPENYVGQLMSGPPRIVVFCDAVDFGGKPGCVRWFRPEDLTTTTGVSTHRRSLRLLASCLRQGGVESIWIVGIQPTCTGIGAEVSPAVVGAVDDLRVQLEALLGRGADELEAFATREARANGCRAPGPVTAVDGAPDQ